MHGMDGCMVGYLLAICNYTKKLMNAIPLGSFTSMSGDICYSKICLLNAKVIIVNEASMYMMVPHKQNFCNLISCSHNLKRYGNKEI